MRSGIQDHAVLEISVRVVNYALLDSLNWRSYNVKCATIVVYTMDFQSTFLEK